MIQNDDETSRTYRKGSSESIVERFSINGLHGYRSISLSSPYAATVLIAQNGSGKTTLLGALDAFLKGQYSRLKEIIFTEIRCKLRDVEKELVLRREDIISLFDIPAESEISRLARRSDQDPLVLLTFLIEDFDRLKLDLRLMDDEPVYTAVRNVVGYRHVDVVEALEKAKVSAFAHSPELLSISQAVASVLKDTEIVYLPTYRRIEIPWTAEQDSPYRRKKRTKFRFNKSGLFSGDIQFGLADISERLSDLNQKILIDSNKGYRQISADIVNELIDGTLERGNYDSEAIPTQADLSLFFSRLKEGRRVGPFQSFQDVSVPNIEKIYSGGEIPTESNKFLRYFLSKLSAVIDATSVVEKPVQDFIDSCNKYLSPRMAEDFMPRDNNKGDRIAGIDDKMLRLDRRTLQVYAESVRSGRKISLEALSSGEKQMVSLFGKLFLYPNKKIVLIDEPELSLSLDWQREIIPDVINAPLCQQIIAITHSPFIFDNALDPFARPLELAIDVEAAQKLDPEAGLEDLDD
ncbi:AAA family ATPase [Devosia sp. YIM 151766]|uniref:AAA family ATPase n=1 Tax=Devosia sp. YIM 151766 TaxID=3017325 RepID=UPI00255C6B40|nr:AAA family ATPase [Devosia sp. YIM 151766]WIY52168.1 AAA family ATPase [Devosia sp. YIM 151766]